MYRQRGASSKSGGVAAWKLNGCIVLVCMLLVASAAGEQSEGSGQTGFYLITAESETAASLPQPSGSQQVMLYTGKYLEGSASEQPLYLLLPSKPDVPLELSKAPTLIPEGGNGFPELQLALTTSSARKLEALTRHHMGQRVAFVIDGEPVSIRKIRGVITDGQFRLSRCTDSACQYIYSRLKPEP